MAQNLLKWDSDDEEMDVAAPMPLSKEATVKKKSSLLPWCSPLSLEQDTPSLPPPLPSVFDLLDDSKKEFNQDRKEAAAAPPLKGMDLSKEATVKKKSSLLPWCSPSSVEQDIPSLSPPLPSVFDLLDASKEEKNHQDQKIDTAAPPPKGKPLVKEAGKKGPSDSSSPSSEDNHPPQTLTPTPPEPVASTSSSSTPPTPTAGTVDPPPENEVDDGTIKVRIGRSELLDTFLQYEDQLGFDNADGRFKVTVSTISLPEYRRLQRKWNKEPRVISAEHDVAVANYKVEVAKFAAKKRARKERMMANPDSRF